MNFQNPFNRAHQKRLLNKAVNLGINVWVLLQTGKNRKPVNGLSSQWAEASSSVCQRFILGPVLFNLFIKKLDLGVSVKVCMTAPNYSKGEI